MSLNVVTSCSAAGWEKYGRRFVETYLQYWPKSCQLHVVSEDESAPIDGMLFHPLDDSVLWQEFETDNGSKRWVAGDSASPRPPECTSMWRKQAGYNFRYDAYKFSKKVFAIELIASKIKTGRLCWVDADVVTFAPVPEDLFPRMLPSSYALSCLERRVGYHSECGFVGYNLDHPDTHHFISRFAALYTSGEVFGLHEWHDSWVFDWLRKKLITPTYAIPHKSQGHPFINSELGKYMDHLEGKRKDSGSSQPQEQLAHKHIPYWKGGAIRI